MPWHFSWCYILHALFHYLGAYLESVFWSLVLVKNILRICFVPPVLIFRIHRSICGESFRCFCILLLRLDLLRCISEIEWFVLRFQLFAFYVLLPGSLVPSILWGLWLWHNIITFLLFSEVFSDFIHPIIQLVIFLTSYDCYFHKRVVSRGMVSPAVVSVSFVVKNVVLRIHILALEVWPFIFHSPTILLSWCTTSLPSLFLPCIFFHCCFQL